MVSHTENDISLKSLLIVYSMLVIFMIAIVITISTCLKSDKNVSYLKVQFLFNQIHYFQKENIETGNKQYFPEDKIESQALRSIKNSDMHKVLSMYIYKVSLIFALFSLIPTISVLQFWQNISIFRIHCQKEKEFFGHIDNLKAVLVLYDLNILMKADKC